MIEQARAKVLPVPVVWDELYPSRFIKAVEFKGKKPTLTMTDVKLEELVGDKGPQIKGVVCFKETEKQWALNKTNGICLKEMFGRKLAEWIGKRVTLYAGEWNGEECIRVWGSPDIEADKRITVSLPRKRPQEMLMHKTVRSVPTSASPPGKNGLPHYDKAKAIEALKDQPDVEALDAKWQEIVADYKATNREVPLDVEATWNDRRTALEQA